MIRSNNPPLPFINLSEIHDTAEPQATNIKSSRFAPQPFQKASNAVTNPDLGVSSQGNSSIKTSIRWPSALDSRNFSNIKNASNQFVGSEEISAPHLRRECVKFCSCIFINSFPLISIGDKAVCENVIRSRNSSLTRNVFPTRLRPYSTTNSE